MMAMITTRDLRRQPRRYKHAPRPTPTIPVPSIPYAPGLPVDWQSGKKTICFLTRCHPARPNMQKACIDSVKAQTCDDWQHFLIQGAMRASDEQSRGDGTFAIEHGLTKPWPIDAHYVMVLDDDNMLAYPGFVQEFKGLVQAASPDIVFFKAEIKGSGTYPWWNHAPVAGHIDWFCFAVKQEMWKWGMKEIEAHPNLRTNCNDFLFIDTCYRNTGAVIWFDRLVATTQRGPGRCRPETEF